MFKYILVPVSGGEADASVLRGAAILARRSGGHLAFLHVRPDVANLAAAMAITAFADAAWNGGYLDALQQDVTERQARAKAALERFCTTEGIVFSGVSTTAGVTAAWHAERGEVADCLARFGRTADLLVLGRPGDTTWAPADLLDTALLTVGRPLLIVPPRPPAQLGEVVAIAWKETAEAAHAITAALPLLETARRVVILSVTEQASADQESCERLRQALVWHNLATTVQHLAPEGLEPADRLLNAAVRIGADLLVMGGYGHSRMREVAFGGFTRHVLHAAELPVLMAH
ncbi:MAG TPA: universal stress protein [Acetobacteraceae bacterium]|nr:universal stress protein [Acetobacteraceae bacterium]